MILGFKEFRYVGSRELFIEPLNTRRQPMLRLELWRLLYIRYHDPEALRYELVPAVIKNDSQFDEIIANNNLKKRLLSFQRTGKVFGENPGGKSILGIVSHSQGFLGVVANNDEGNWTKRLVGEETHVRFDIRVNDG